jgi:hypothetical protein
MLASRYRLNMLTFACSSPSPQFFDLHLNLCPNSLVIMPKDISIVTIKILSETSLMHGSILFAMRDAGHASRE